MAICLMYMYSIYFILDFNLTQSYFICMEPFSDYTMIEFE
jgi:hypothetical protein